MRWVHRSASHPVRPSRSPAIWRRFDQSAGRRRPVYRRIHRLSRQVEEVLYPALEDYALDIMIGKGPSAQSIRINLPGLRWWGHYACQIGHLCGTGLVC